MERNKSANAVIASAVIGVAAIAVGVFFYRRSGRNWQSDMKSAKGWMSDRAHDMGEMAQKGKGRAQHMLDKTEKASRELMENAKALGERSMDSIHSVADKTRHKLS